MAVLVTKLATTGHCLPPQPGLRVAVVDLHARVGGDFWANCATCRARCR